MFASTELASRIERAECRLIQDGVAAFARRDSSAQVLVQPLAGGLAAYASDGSPLNKVAGLGFGGPLDPDELERVEALCARRGAAVQVELACLGDPSIAAAISRRGYVLHGFENVLGRRLPLAEVARRDPGIDVARCRRDELDAWIEVVVSGFAAPDTQGVPSHESYPRELLEPILGDLARADGFLLYLARRGGVAAGGASLRLFEGVAQLCGAATLPEQRRRGVQSALLATRLADASRAGCDVAVMTTQPGSKSQENAQRQGFALLYTRAVLVRAP